MFKFNSSPPRYTGFKKPIPAPEPAPEPARRAPIKTDGMQGDTLRLSKIMNWTSEQIRNKESKVFAGRNEHKTDEILTLSQLAAEYLQNGESCGRVLDRLEMTVKELDPSADI